MRIAAVHGKLRSGKTYVCKHRITCRFDALERFKGIFFRRWKCVLMTPSRAQYSEAGCEASFKVLFLSGLKNILKALKDILWTVFGH